jgi:hypothetical protein
MPELLWKAYIDFEMENEDYDRARALYRRLLERTKHVRVWISFAKFEATLGKIERARAVYKEAFLSLKPAEFTEAVRREGSREGEGVLAARVKGELEEPGEEAGGAGGRRRKGGGSRRGEEAAGGAQKIFVLSFFFSESCSSSPGAILKKRAETATPKNSFATICPSGSSRGGSCKRKMDKTPDLRNITIMFSPTRRTSEPE